VRRNGQKPLDAFLVLARASFGDRRHRSPVRIVVTILVLVLLLALPIHLLWPGPEQPPLLLAAFDQVALPSETITLRSAVEALGQEKTSANLARCKLYFQDLQSNWRNEVTTDRDGLATTERSFAAANAPVEIMVRYPGDGPRQHGNQAKSRVFVWPAESDLLIVDADSTLPDVDAENLWTASNLDIRPRPGATDCLRSARAKYRIVYTCAAADRPSRYNKLRTWLERGWAQEQEQFPDGPLLACACGPPERRTVEFLQATLSDLRARLQGTMVGITGDRHNAQSYHAAGCRTFLLGETGETPEGVTAIKSWSEFKHQLP
jgi:hypothetical protein